MIVPTGLGCPIGGHAGDANPTARLLGAACEELVLHPNVVNASDINEMPENALYVDGHALDLFLEEQIVLRYVRSNRILLVANNPVSVETRNAVGAARATLGAKIEIVELDERLRMIARLGENGAAVGDHEGVASLVEKVGGFFPKQFDALAISSEIEVDRTLAESYLRAPDGVNPWGGIETKVSGLISDRLSGTVPVAHAPIDGVIKEWDEVVEDTKAAECVSVAYLHCVLKGLHIAPRLIPFSEARECDLAVEDIDMLVSPSCCWGRPHEAAVKAGIEVVWVQDNMPEVPARGTDDDWKRWKHTNVGSYLEVAGLIAARKAGVSIESVTRRR